MDSNTILEQMRHDPFAHFLGIELMEVREGYARAALTVQEHMLNLHGIPHGGVIFALADAAFAAASNSHGQVAVALNVNINFLAAAQPGARLIAEATEEHLTRRTGLYRLAVTSEDGVLIALAHGTVYRKDQPVIPPDGQSAA